MTRYGLRKIDLGTVLNDYGSIVENTHFNVKNSEEFNCDENLKPISIDDVGMLMAIGVEGLHFLNMVLVRSLDGYELSDEQKWVIYCECDGFGKLSSEELKNINEGWDWSHIRDSSAEAIYNAEIKTKEFLIEMYNAKV